MGVYDGRFQSQNPLESKLLTVQQETTPSQRGVKEVKTQASWAIKVGSNSSRWWRGPSKMVDVVCLKSSSSFWLCNGHGRG